MFNSELNNINKNKNNHKKKISNHDIDEKNHSEKTKNILEIAFFKNEIDKIDEIDQIKLFNSQAFDFEDNVFNLLSDWD